MRKGNEAVRQHLSLLTRLTGELDQTAAEILAQEFQWESFGSWYVVVRRHGQQFRLVFEGRDRALLAYRIPEAGQRSTRQAELIGEQPLECGLTAESFEVVCAFITKVTEAGAAE